MLPADKRSLPKCLYLDQNKWIDLGRAHYGREDGEQFKEALDAVREAVRRGTVVVPMSGVHVMETMAPADEARRRRLAEFMVDLSENRSILPHIAVRSLEITQAVVRKLGLKTTTSIRANIIQAGLSYALGAEAVVTAPSPVIAEQLKTIANSPEASVICLVHAADRATVVASRKEDEEAVQQLEEVRRRAKKDLSDEMRHRVELADLFTRGEPGRELREVLSLFGIPAREFFARFNSPEDFTAFFHDVPSIDVMVTLSLERDNIIERPIHRNDLKDIAFMSVALPYANILVCEKFWAHMANFTGLATKYGTTVANDATSLPKLLREADCL